MGAVGRPASEWCLAPVCSMIQGAPLAGMAAGCLLTSCAAPALWAAGKNGDVGNPAVEPVRSSRTGARAGTEPCPRLKPRPPRFARSSAPRVRSWLLLRPGPYLTPSGAGRYRRKRKELLQCSPVLTWIGPARSPGPHQAKQLVPLQAHRVDVATHSEKRAEDHFARFWFARFWLPCPASPPRPLRSHSRRSPAKPLPAPKC